MTISVNGALLEMSDGATVAVLLQQLGIDRERVAVELNIDIVSKKNYDSQLLADGDKIEIVHFVGGGQSL